jgi:undecaprenyl-diphosphatase
MAASKIKKTVKRVTRAEAAVARASARHRESIGMRIVSKLSEIGDQPQMRLASGAFILGGLLSGRHRHARAGVRMLLAHELATAMKDFVKERVDRTRPRSAANGESQAKLGDRTGKEHTSFPSGHTAGAIAVAQAFAREFPEHGTSARLAAGAVGVAQIPRCAHYPTDVGVGAIVGFAAEAAVTRLWTAIDRVADEPPRREVPLLPPPRV